MIFKPVNVAYLIVRNGRVVSGSVSGIVKSRDPLTQALTPKQARVDALEDRTGRLVGSAWSDPKTGAYTIKGLDETMAHTVLARDPEQQMRPVSADRLMPEAAR